MFDEESGALRKTPEMSYRALPGQIARHGVGPPRGPSPGVIPGCGVRPSPCVVLGLPRILL